jgi:hypothetical protein
MAELHSGFDEQIGIIKETNMGEIPTNPNFQLLPVGSATLKTNRETLESNRLGVNSRFGTRLGGYNVNGDLVGELVFGAFDELLAAAIGGTWVADTPATGTDQAKGGRGRQGFTVVRKRGDKGFQYFRGCEVNSIALTIGQNAAVSCTYNLLGLEELGDNSALVGQSLLPMTDAYPFTGFDVAITQGGQVVAIATAATLNVNRNLTTSFNLGSYVAGSKAPGKLLVDGSLTVDFVDMAYQQAFLNETRSDLEMQLTDYQTGDVLYIKLPDVLYTQKQDDTTSDGPVPIVMTFFGEYDATEETSIILERTPA